ncbi:MAG: hypothetical protein NTY61_00690 [Candidatus Parcubacteria bacterium]|nr:hypothetical protein [Candidatus Parcubacteria bacterium]
MAQQKKIYILAGKTDRLAVEQLKAHLIEASQEYNLEFIFICRESLEEAQAHFGEDTQGPLDLIFISLSLTPSDRATLNKIRDVYDPHLDINSFSSLSLVKQLKAKQPDCNVIFINRYEHRGITMFLLSEETQGDWVFEPLPLTKGLVTLWIMLFIVDPRKSQS